ncbi:3-oxoacyl-ACP synthase [Fulvivirga sp. RKSG066]|uniref:GreA/GreB family elongation factor n=1 Tax=Fulvivirga aurantia TaxID=2529383 RepID=UPI0012BB521C|nr:GreA/GreB family elongation factor [Fulvivirga aurantia]MTI22895.1 3-oxoacyl-ACP synthase [Fulvivirga aurantia]
MTKETLKKSLHEACLDFVNNRIKNAEEAIVSAQESANEETKSSSGDKFETGRAMMQREVENLSVQLTEARKLEEILINMNPTINHDSVSKGAVVKTTMGNYYISVSAGKISLDEGDFFAITPASPIGQAMSGMKEGDSFEWNSKKITIKEIS